MDLFADTGGGQETPLAYRMSPRSLDEYIGQDHIVGEGRLLRRVIQADRLSSLIFYGPPGTGKTSLARVIAHTTKSAFTTLNAVLTGVKDLRAEIDSAKERRDLYQSRTILFVDEVHRWNKAQQDALLPSVENGTIILIGATTHNPYFEVNSALVSRSRIFQLTPLSGEELFTVARQALGDPARGYGSYEVEFEDGALEHLVSIAAGDARSLLNALELAVETTPESFPPPPGEKIRVSFEATEESIQRKAVLYDKEGDYHFDVISAFIKSIRGSDPDAALYWLAKMVHAGEDPKFIFRRMLISAGEDIGMADPHALTVVESAAAAFDRVGMPEGRYHLAHATLYLAAAPKSNSALGFFDALDTVKNEGDEGVPRHLQDANRDKKAFGHGEGYLYPHAYREHWVAQQYLPSSLQGRIFYNPTEAGYEAAIREEVHRRREANLAAMVGDETPEVLSYSPPDRERERWLARVADERSSGLLELRDQLFRLLEPARHHRILDLAADDGLFLWEALRRAPEGGVCGIVSSCEKKENLEHYAAALDLAERPELVCRENLLDSAGRGDSVGRGNSTGQGDSTGLQGAFERVVGRNCTVRAEDREKVFHLVRQTLREGGRAVLAEIIPRQSPRLSELEELKGLGGAPSSREQHDKSERNLMGILRRAEEILYNETNHPLLAWDGEELEEAAKKASFSKVEGRRFRIEERRHIRAEHIERWFSGFSDSGTISDSGGGTSSSAAASAAAPVPQTLGDAVAAAAREVSGSSTAARAAADKPLEALKRRVTELLADRTVSWYSEYYILLLRKQTHV